MRISDNVAKYILELMEQADGVAEIQRNELAADLGCVPSQISYVITSRFTPEHGYIVESRRGGGGYIRITRRQLSPSDLIMHIINSVGSTLDAATAAAMTDNMYRSGILREPEKLLIQAAISDKSLKFLPKDVRDQIRANIFKNMLLTIKV